MTVQELLSYIDDIRPNAFTDGQKLIWLNELEARIQREVLPQFSAQKDLPLNSCL